MSADKEDFAALLAAYDAPERSRGPAVGETVEGKVLSIGREAVFVDLGPGARVEGMLELDQVTGDDGELIVAVGDRIEARVVDTGGRNGCILLRRHVARGAEARNELAIAYEHRTPIEGVVTAINKGGAEVEVGGLRAFCPISQLDSRFVEDAQVFVGRALQFRVSRLEPGRGQEMNVVLSRRELLQEEAAAAATELRKTLEVGSVLEGTVTSLKPYGAFVDLGGLEGMLHISELGHQRVDHPGDVLAEGQKVRVQVIKIERAGDDSRERIALSLKSLAADPWDAAAGQFAENSMVKGTVVRLQPFGAFVELAPGVEGLIHISQLGSGRRLNHPREAVREGEEVEARILSIDLERRRISLSLQAEGDDIEPTVGAAELRAINQPATRGLGTFADLLKAASKSD